MNMSPRMVSPLANLLFVMTIGIPRYPASCHVIPAFPYSHSYCRRTLSDAAFWIASATAELVMSVIRVT